MFVRPRGTKVPNKQYGLRLFACVLWDMKSLRHNEKFDDGRGPNYSKKGLLERLKGHLMPSTFWNITFYGVSRHIKWTRVFEIFDGTPLCFRDLFKFRLLIVLWNIPRINFVCWFLVYVCVCMCATFEMLEELLRKILRMQFFLIKLW